MASERRLPLLPPSVVKGSLRADGSREPIHPADVRGRFTFSRRTFYLLLIALWAALPWIRLGGHPALFLDIDRRRFFVFGATFNAQDTWLVFFLLTGIGFGLIYVTALLGRVWCGWACPQTVFLDAVYRRIERWVEGPREVRMRRNGTPLTFETAARKVVKHALFLVASLGIAHIVLSYFVSMPQMLRMVSGAPSAHPEAFAWAAAVTAVLYGNFAFFREQLCLIVCPYGRLQSVLIDADSAVIGYDHKRGEPRGKASDPKAGACVDCKRCVVVCPTGIDIRNGLQVDCVACTACIDACDEVMDKLGRPRGLVRYTSTHALAGEETSVWRPRIALYSVLLVTGVVAASLALRKREPFEANVLRQAGEPYVFDGANLRDSFEVHVVNKTSERQTYVLEGQADAKGVEFLFAQPSVTLGELEDKRIKLFVTQPREAYTGDFELRVHVWPEAHRELDHVVSVRFLGAKTAGAK